MDKKPLPPPQEKSVFEQVKKQREPKGKASVQDILKADVEQSGGDFNRVYAALLQMVYQGKTRIMRSGNSLLIYNILQPGVAEVHISTLDNPKELVKAVKEFYEAMLKVGFKQAVTTTENPQIIRVLNAAGIKTKVSQKPDASGQMTFELSFGA